MHLLELNVWRGIAQEIHNCLMERKEEIKIVRVWMTYEKVSTDLFYLMDMKISLFDSIFHDKFSSHGRFHSIFPSLLLS